MERDFKRLPCPVTSAHVRLFAANQQQIRVLVVPFPFLQAPSIEGPRPYRYPRRAISFARGPIALPRRAYARASESRRDQGQSIQILRLEVGKTGANRKREGSCSDWHG